MRHGTLFLLTGFLLAPTPVRATDPAQYVVEAPDLLRFEVSGLRKSAQPVSGEFMVRPDGTVALGTYGSVPVSGLTLDQTRAAVAKHLSAHAKRGALPDVRATVSAANSKTFYVISPDKEGEVATRFPADGTATVVSAVLQIDGLAAVAAKGRVWVQNKSSGVREVDWKAITQKGDAKTNYKLDAGDRVYVKGARPK